MTQTLLTTSSHKIDVSNSADTGYLVKILYLAPSWLSGHNTCGFASLGCILGCLNLAGRGPMNSVQQARIRRTQWLYSDRQGFMVKLSHEIHNHAKLAARQGLKPAIRLNGTSDICWEHIRIDGQTIFDLHPDVMFYDYTKFPIATRQQLPANYYLCQSYSEDRPHVDVSQRNLAVVFHGKALPTTWQGTPVIDGTKHDLRFLDSAGVIVGLLALGKARRDTTGFVVHLAA